MDMYIENFAFRQTRATLSLPLTKPQLVQHLTDALRWLNSKYFYPYLCFTPEYKEIHKCRLKVGDLISFDAWVSFKERHSLLKEEIRDESKRDFWGQEKKSVDPQQDEKDRTQMKGNKTLLMFPKSSELRRVTIRGHHFTEKHLRNTKLFSYRQRLTFISPPSEIIDGGLGRQGPEDEVITTFI